VQLLGSGTILLEVIEGAALLEQDFGISADIWSAPSFNQLARDGHVAQRWNLLHPTEPPRQPYVSQCLEGQAGPVIAATDYMRLYADQIRAFVPGRYVVLGTDGYGRSDTRARLRRHFEVDRHQVVVAALKALADDGAIKPATVAEAIAKYKIDTGRAAPWTV
jgi:pyruvate dehydrogenase E1 component